MAKIVILMGRGNSGKTRTINKLGDILGLTKYESRYKGIYPSFVTWAGQAYEILMRTGSLQESARERLRLLLAQTSSLQEKNEAILDQVMKDAKDWIDYLKDKPDAIAIIPFTLTGKNAMEELILKPLELFRQSGNEIDLIYLEKKDISEKALVENVVDKASPNHTIQGVRDEEQRQAEELIKYLSLEPIKKISPIPITEFI